jgi:hypothetical protein
MQIPPSTALLHALSRVGENAPAQARPAPRTGDESVRATVAPDAARAAAKAAFQALRPAQPAPVNVVTQPQAAATATQQQPARQLPRGSFLNVLV